MLPNGLHLIDLPQPRPGYRRFISSWFFIDPQGRHILVDPGPANTIPMLLEALTPLTNKIDLILLTHIHLDHSGGVAQLCESYDSAKVVAHRKASRHLIDPKTLWEASLATTGDVALMYGQPKQLAPDKLLDYDREELAGIKIMETPGHAPHHLCFIVPFNGEELFFVGEAAGLHMLTEDGKAYIRPASPGKFDAPAALASLTEMEAAIQGDELLCYAHWGAARDAKAYLAAAKTQINYWLDTIGKMQNCTLGQIAEYLLSNDKFLAGHSTLSEDLRQRELLFMENNIKGFLAYLKDS